MKLSKAETRKLNESLATLKKMTATQVSQIAQDKKIGVDAAYVNKLVEAYVTEDGFACMLLDTLLAGPKCGPGNCVCGVTCASPCKNSMTGVGT
jgi:hypothetical protein